MSEPLDSEGTSHPHTTPRTVCSAIGAKLEALESGDIIMAKHDFFSRSSCFHLKQPS
jgi:hypothetical protein